MAKILVFYQYYCTPKGSWGTRYYELSRRWASQGHDVKIITSVYDKSDIEADGFISRSNIEGAEVVAIDVGTSNKHGIARRLAAFGMFSATSCWFALKEDADVVIASSGPLSVGVPGLLARWARKKPLLFEVRDLWPDVQVAVSGVKNPVAVGLSRALEWACYASASRVVALSPAMAPFIQKVVPRAKVETVTNASDLDLFRPDRAVSSAIAESTEGKFTLLYAGTLGSANFGPEILDIAVELRRRGADDVQIKIAGDGAERKTLEERARRDGLTNVEFLGVLGKEAVAEWHAAASMILIGLKDHPILHTSSPNKLFDALAAGRPVLNNTPGWIADVLKDGECGFSHRPGDIAQAADDILTLRDDPERHRRMCQNARRVAESDFARDELAGRYLDIIEEVCQA